MSEHSVIVAVYRAHQDAEYAAAELRRAGFDMKKLSIIGRDFQTEQQLAGEDYDAADRSEHSGRQGVLWGSLDTLLVGTTLFLMPGVGPVLVAGPVAAYIVSAVEGAVVVGGLSAIGAGLLSIGIPKNSALKYEAALNADRFLMIAQGTRDETQHARDVIETTKAADIGVHVLDTQEAVSAGGATA